MTPRSSCNLLLLSAFLLFIISTATSISDDSNAELGVYYETPCPSCSDFNDNELLNRFGNGLINLMDLNLVPNRNTELAGTNTTTICKDGAYECALSTVEACSIYVWTNVVMRSGNGEEWGHVCNSICRSKPNIVPKTCKVEEQSIPKDAVVKPEAPSSTLIATRYILALQWPPSACRMPNPRPCHSVHRFTIHGLWPQNRYCKANFPINCNPSDVFNSSNIIAIRSRLEQAWPDLYNQNNPEAFWRREWRIHGTCSGLTQLEYFNLTLGLFNWISPSTQDLLALLATRGVTPSWQEKYYNPSIILGELKYLYGVLVRIACNHQPVEDMLELHFPFYYNISTNIYHLDSVKKRCSDWCKNASVGFYY